MSNENNNTMKNSRTLLLENDFCLIYNYSGEINSFVREDKITGSRVLVDSYFDEDGTLIRRNVELTAEELELVLSSLSMTIAAIDTAENKEVYLALYDKLTK